MGYSLTIGEREVITEDEYTYTSAKTVTLEEAPAFGEPTDHTNGRWPSYTAWHNFCQSAGLIDVFYTKAGRMRGGHPGCFTIDEDFKAKIDQVHNRVKMQYKTVDQSADIFDSEIGGTYARLQWLKFWTDWALENCEHPVFVNS